MLGFEARIGLEEGLRRLVDWRRNVLERGQSEHYDQALSASARGQVNSEAVR